MSWKNVSESNNNNNGQNRKTTFKEKLWSFSMGMLYNVARVHIYNIIIMHILNECEYKKNHDSALSCLFIILMLCIYVLYFLSVLRFGSAELFRTLVCLLFFCHYFLSTWLWCGFVFLFVSFFCLFACLFGIILVGAAVACLAVDYSRAESLLTKPYSIRGGCLPNYTFRCTVYVNVCCVGCVCCCYRQ